MSSSPHAPTIQTAILAQLIRVGPRRHVGYVLADVVNCVMTLHRPITDAGITFCSSCGSGEAHEYPTEWPCDTLKAVAAGLGLKEGDWR